MKANKGRYGFLFLLFLSIFFGCGKKSTPKYKVGFSQCTGRDNWRQNMLAEMKRELFYHPELELIYKDADGDNKTQIQQIRELINQKIDILLVSPNEAAPLDTVIANAYSRGIPVIILDRKAVTDSFTAYIGGDNYNIGKLAAEYIAGELKGKGKIVEVTGLHGSSPTIERHKGFQEALTKYPGLQVIATFEGDWEAEKTLKNAIGNEAAIREASVVFAHNDIMAHSLYKYCRSKGLDSIRFIGVDASPYPDGGIDLVSKGILSASFLYPSGGKEAITMASDILAGKQVKRNILLQTILIDKTNVQLMRLQIDKILAQHQEIEQQQSILQEQRRLYQDQQHLLRIVVTSLVVAFILGIILFNILRINRRINRKLKQQRDEIQLQRDQLVEMTSKAQEATEAKFAFFTNLSHEFRTPLTLIQAPMEYLLNSRQISSPQKQQLELMRKNVTRLIRMVDQLLEFRRIESGKLQLKVSENDLSLFLTDIMESFKGIAVKKNIDFRLICRQPAIKAWFDVRLFDRVLYNLLSNAFKFTGNRGKVHIHVKRPENDQVAIISVEDDGAGMDAQTLAHAFELFYQSRHTEHKGTGIGLALSKEIMALHHGTINVESKEGFGATFTITLPTNCTSFLPEEIQSEQEFENNTMVDPHLYGLPDEIEMLPPSYPAAIPAGDHSYSILIIEDHSDLNKFIGNYLSEQYEIFYAENGDEGLQIAFTQIPDLILCDVMLPGMDGITLLNILKKDVRTSHIPVILMSADGSDEQRIKAMRHNVDAFIGKPFNLTFLVENISSILNNRSILKEHLVISPETRIHSSVLSKTDRKFINDFAAVVEKNLGNDQFGVESICKDLSISKMQLYRKVKQQLNCNVNDYILDARIKKSCYLLINSSESISDIAYSCGFSSSSYFSTVFKSRCKTTPKQYRDQGKGL